MKLFPALREVERLEEVPSQRIFLANSTFKGRVAEQRRLQTTRRDLAAQSAPELGQKSLRPSLWRDARATDTIGRKLLVLGNQGSRSIDRVDEGLGHPRIGIRLGSRLPTAFIVNSRDDALEKFRNSERAGLRRIAYEIDVACTRDIFHFDRIQAAQHRMRYILIPIQIDLAVLVRMKLSQQFPTIG